MGAPMNTTPIEIWTIGHSTRSIEEFIALLNESNIKAVADVRRFPGSRRHPQFSQSQLATALADAGMEYFHLPELGGRRAPRRDSPNTAWRNEAFRGYADYMMTADFRAGMKRLLEIARRSRTAILCAEALWWRCHRSLIADELKVEGHTVWNILGPGKVQLHPFTSAARIFNGKLSYAASDLPLMAMRLPPARRQTKPSKNRGLADNAQRKPRPP
jgi:uncharacterized protein (DUF488 family)